MIPETIWLALMCYQGSTLLDHMTILMCLGSGCQGGATLVSFCLFRECFH